MAARKKSRLKFIFVTSITLSRPGLKIIIFKIQGTENQLSFPGKY